LDWLSFFWVSRPSFGSWPPRTLKQFLN